MILDRFGSLLWTLYSAHTLMFRAASDVGSHGSPSYQVRTRRMVDRYLRRVTPYILDLELKLTSRVIGTAHLDVTVDVRLGLL